MKTHTQLGDEQGGQQKLTRVRVGRDPEYAWGGIRLGSDSEKGAGSSEGQRAEEETCEEEEERR